MRVLGIESSCDETAAAVVEDGRRVLSNVVASQEALHVPYGGVVPEIACRAHLAEAVPVARKALESAGLTLADMDAIAVVNRPGLIGSLLVGVSVAKGMAWASGKPLVSVDHIHAHLYAAALERETPAYPSVGLVVSGGHSSLYHCRTPIDLERMGATMDDAAGEAFDKVAKLLNLGYPGGPAVERTASGGDPKAVRLPRSWPSAGAFDFSFSGLKTAVLYRCKGQPGAKGSGQPAALSQQDTADLCASFQEAVVDVLAARALEACLARGEKRLIVGGGVACNGRLRARLEEDARREGIELLLPAKRFCPDNAAMVAGLGFHLFQMIQV